MKVPLSWLREFVDVDVEPARLAQDLTLCGLAVDTVEEVVGDVVLDLDITTNRVDCMNVYGVAREVAVLYGKPLRPIPSKVVETSAPAAEAVSVVVSAPDLCPRFCARVAEVTVGPSPDWLRGRLEAAGVRSINNVVDVTNYVMIEMGQPSHAFDAAQIPQSRLDVRWAKDGEKLRTLDGVERALGRSHGVVAGPAEPLALAGIMGGAESEVSGTTREVVLEAAHWNPLAIRRGARSLAMHTEASHRFERGADPEAPPLALDRIAHLLARVGAGTTRPGIIDVRPAPRTAREVTLRYAQVKRILGGEVPRERCDSILEGLGFRHLEGGAEQSRFAVPTWRSDITREVDLVEEIGRHFGLGVLPTTFSAGAVSAGLDRARVRERMVREVLTGAGFTENVNYAFVSSKGAAAYGEPSVVLENPMSEDRDVLRTSLVFPGLLSNLETNLRHGRRDVRLFEIGRVFAEAADRPVERLRVGFAAAGSLHRAHWSEKPRPADFFDGRGVVEAVLSALGAPRARFEASAVPGFLHPGQGAWVVSNGKPPGYVGVLHPDLAAPLDARSKVVVGELDLDGLLAAGPEALAVSPLPRFPEVARDLSVVCGAAQTAEELVDLVERSGGPHLAAVTVTDRYEGPPLPPGQVSLTLRLRFQHPERTLTGAEVQEFVAGVVDALSQAGVEIRGEG